MADLCCPKILTLADDIWHDQPAYLVGGGPSLKSFDWTLLADKKHVIAINRAYREVPTAEIWFSEDIRVVNIFAKDPAWRNFKGHKILHALNVTFAENVKTFEDISVIERKRGDKYWSYSLSDGLALASNSGVGAINLAYILGANPIYLLGFDCRSETDMEQNYHTTYEDHGFDRTSSQQYESFRSDFDAWVAPHVRDRNIINLIAPEFPSAIRSWPKLNWREILMEKGKHLDRESLQTSLPPADPK